VDAHTLELLEFEKIRELAASRAATPLGQELCRRIEPAVDLHWIGAQIRLVTEMVEAIGEGQSPPFGGLHDVRLLVRRAAIGAMLTPDQLLLVADTLTATGHIYRYRMRLSERFQGLIHLLAPIEDLGTVAKAIAGCIDPRGNVLDMASPELARLRRQLADIDERVQGRIKKLLRDPELRKALRFPNATVSGDHYVLPVAINYRHKLAGIVHRTSSTGETVYIEPAEVASLSAERVLLKVDEDKEVRRILRRLSGQIGQVARSLSTAIDAMAQLDLVTAKARLSRDFSMSPPGMMAERRLWLRQARHPILENLFRSATSGPADSAQPETPSGTGQVVPIDVRLGYGFNLLVITGPNTGGKTVTLKTTGLLCLMAQAGMHIPAAEGSVVPVFHSILADIGDEQSLEQSLSTFSAHMSRLAGIFRQADDHSLVLLDELGAGTDPTEGAALGRAILDQLDRVGCLAMVTTHLGDLKTYAFSNERAENAAVEFDGETLQPTYRLNIGQFGMSNALKIAQRLQLPRALVRRAHRYLRRRQRRAPELKQLQDRRAEAEKARADALQAQLDAERQREEYRQKLQDLERAAEEKAQLRAARLRLQPGDSVRVARFDGVGRIVRLDARRNTAVVSVGLGQWQVPLDEVFPVESPGNQ
jgi:DNA mismatch repair protein MutS2